MSRQVHTKSSIFRLTVGFVAVLAAAPPLMAQFGMGRDVIAPTRILQGENDRSRPADTRAGNRAVDRQQQVQANMQQTAAQLDETLVEILEMVNNREKLTPEQIANCRATYDAARKYAPQFDNALKCETFMLRAWTEYFAKDLEQAFIAAKTACETDRTNQDAAATQIAMSIFLGRVPLKIEPRRARTVPGRADTVAARQNERAAQINVRASSGNILDLDTDAIDLSLLGKPVGPMKLTCLNATTLDYNPARSSLCVLFWQLGAPEASGEPNNMSNMAGRMPLQRGMAQNMSGSRAADAGNRGRADTRRGNVYDEPAYDNYRQPAAYDGYGYGDARQQGSAQGDPLAVETAAYGRLFSSYLLNPQVTFLGVNMDPLTSAPAVAQKLLESPWPWANTMAAVPTGGAAQFAGLKPTRPTLAIASAGKIIYAGPADGFLAPMVLEHLAGEPVTLNALAAQVGTAAPASTTLNPLRNILGGASGSQPAAPPAVLSGTQAPQQPQTGGEEEYTFEDAQAEKLLGAARDLFIPAGRKTLLTSRQGVNLCRQIIREYPNTKYAQEARLLLRQVPENERRRYNVTDEEMGL
ncbi:MAG: hypothetical protein IH624_15945 [Phycisphaerae bacterium]|nr:hypothetical protein [Phycisphaerae bacterium]